MTASYYWLERLWISLKCCSCICFRKWCCKMWEFWKYHLYAFIEILRVDSIGPWNLPYSFSCRCDKSLRLLWLSYQQKIWMKKTGLVSSLIVFLTLDWLWPRPLPIWSRIFTQYYDDCAGIAYVCLLIDEPVYDSYPHDQTFPRYNTSLKPKKDPWVIIFSQSGSFYGSDERVFCVGGFSWGGIDGIMTGLRGPSHITCDSHNSACVPVQISQPLSWKSLMSRMTAAEYQKIDLCKCSTMLSLPEWETCGMAQIGTWLWIYRLNLWKPDTFGFTRRIFGHFRFHFSIEWHRGILRT